MMVMIQNKDGLAETQQATWVFIPQIGPWLETLVIDLIHNGGLAMNKLMRHLSMTYTHIKSCGIAVVIHKWKHRNTRDTYINNVNTHIHIVHTRDTGIPAYIYGYMHACMHRCIYDLFCVCTSIYI